MLPGKLCIGILEEDNPLKAYFRLKPLLMEKDGRYQPYDGLEKYPEDGCIRIVPDKNESSHFKARMRRMGLYCVLDLRDHADENDKIRPNKNYKTDEMERNAYIVYSDVVREPAENMIFEIAAMPAPEGDSAEWTLDPPATPRILLDGSRDIWRFEAGSEEAPARIVRDGGSLPEAEIQIIEIPGFRDEILHLAVRLPETMESVIAAPAPKAEAPAPKAEPVTAPPAPPVEKPWISHEPQPAPRRDPNLSPLQQILAAQSGLNPRRNRSLQEIIEEKWRHSRVDQLGHPIPGGAMGKPVESPVEAAVRAVRHAFARPESQRELISELAHMEEFSAPLQDKQAAIAGEKLRRELEDLEAERLKSLAALDQLRRDKLALREEFKQEIRDEAKGDLKEAIDKARTAQAECKRFRAEAEAARKDAEFARDAMDALEDGRFESRLREFAVNSRAAEIIRNPEKLPPAAGKCAPDTEPTRAEWIERTLRAFAAEGLMLTETEAANLLVCAALGKKLILSGPAAGHKCETARALARALGAQSAGRYIETAAKPGKREDEAVCAGSEIAALALLRDANTLPGDVFRGMHAENLVVAAAVSDAGYPLSADTLEQGFLIRIEPVGADAPWQPLHADCDGFPPLGMAALEKAFLSGAAGMPESLCLRLQKLRAGLAKYEVYLSRRTLDLMWRYCAAMLDVGGLAPMDVLDMAVAQRALPCILAEAPIDCLRGLPQLLAGLPRSLALLKKPLPVLI